MKADSMEVGSDYRCWDELIPDALGLIFRNLSLQEILTVVPRVCKSWSSAVSGPYCWQEIDIEEWSNSRCHPDHLDLMLQMLIPRSCGSLRKLCVSGLHNDKIFSFVADHASSLQTLRLPRSKITDSTVEQIAERLSRVTFLDLSYCCKIGARGLEAIGKNCKLLVGLCRNMHPLDSQLTHDDEAHAIASTMPKLQRLEMAYHVVGTESVLKILSSCLELEFMDLRGCWNVKFDDTFLEEKFPRLKVLGPLVMDCYEINDGEDDRSELSVGSEYLAWEFLGGDMVDYNDDESYDEMWDDERRLEELELSFYEEFHEYTGTYPWPVSR